MSILDTYRYERLSSDNIHHLIPLFNNVFGKKVGLKFLLDKYNTTYTGKSFLGHIAFSNDQPVAYGGFIPCVIQYNQIVEIAAQSVDSMALKEVSGKGVFTQIWRLNEALLISENISFAFGFTNQNSAPVFINKFGWYTQQDLSVFILPASSLPVAKVFHKLGLDKLLQQRVNKAFNGLIATGDMKNPFSFFDSGYVRYDDQFFAYKSNYHRHIVCIEGVNVWLKIGRNLSVGAIENCAKDKFFLIIESLRQLARKLGLTQVILQYSPHSFPANILSEKYQAIQGSSICFKVFKTDIPVDKILFSNADIDTF